LSVYSRQIYPPATGTKSNHSGPESASINVPCMIFNNQALLRPVDRLGRLRLIPA
jgi:hypothetical protein